MNVKAIVWNTFREAVRSKTFYLFIFFGFLFAGSAHFVSMLTIGDKVKVMKDIGLAAIHFFSVLVVIFTGINLVYKEIERKTVYTILSKPISRDSFIIGKFLGLALTTLAALAAMSAIFFLFLLVFTGRFDPRILLYLFMLFLDLSILIAVSLLFSSFSTPILSSIFAICIYLIGQVLWTFNEFKHVLRNPVSKYLALGLYYLLPNFYKFNIKNAVVLGLPVPLRAVLVNVAYALVYIGVALAATIVIFRRREFR